MAAPETIVGYVVEDPYRPGPAEARLATYGVHVWALVEYYQQAVGGDIERVARDYAIPKEAAEAALAYYRAHKRVIDARILLNNASAA